MHKPLDRMSKTSSVQNERAPKSKAQREALFNSKSKIQNLKFNIQNPPPSPRPDPPRSRADFSLFLNPCRCVPPSRTAVRTNPNANFPTRASWWATGNRRGAMVGANAVVTKDVPAGATVVGANRILNFECWIRNCPQALPFKIQLDLFISQSIFDT